VRLILPTNQAQMVKVGLISSDEKGNDMVKDPGADTERLLGDYALAAQSLATDGAQVIVMPEKLGVTIEGNTAKTDALLRSLATQTGATIIAGVVDVDGAVKYNQARIYVPGEGVQRYDKQHMLPPFESNLKPGTSLVLLSRPQQKWGVEICKDL